MSCPRAQCSDRRQGLNLDQLDLDSSNLLDYDTSQYDSKLEIKYLIPKVVSISRSWWIADMAWTRDSLLVLCITRRGSVAVLTKLGEPLEICTEGCSLHTGPSLFLPLHPKITFQ